MEKLLACLAGVCSVCNEKPVKTASEHVLAAYSWPVNYIGKWRMILQKLHRHDRVISSLCAESRGCPPQ